MLQEDASYMAGSFIKRNEASLSSKDQTDFLMLTAAYAGLKV